MNITLEQARKLKDELENSIKSDNTDIQKYNCILKNEDSSINVRYVENLKDKKSQLLLEVYEIMQEINSKRIKGKEFNNRSVAYYVKLRGEFMREKQHLNLLPTIEQLDGKKKSKYTNIVNNEEITLRTRKVTSEINAIDEKLTKFNNSQIVKINVDSELQYILKMLNIIK